MSAAVTNHDEGKPARGKSVRGSRALDSLPMKSRTTGAKALARSRLVKRLRLILPGLGLALVAAFLFNTRSNKPDDAFLDDFKDVSASADELRMANPRFAGVDDKGRPFEITAQSALQTPNDRNFVELDQPRAVQGDGDAVSVVTADKGLYQSETNILDLEENVTLSHEIGADTYVLRTPSAQVTIKDEVVTSDAGVGGESNDGGALRADRMKAYNGEGRVVFEGNVRMRIYPKSKQTGAEASEDADAEENGEETSEQQ